ncbi:hypothetical protein LNAOJCKE_2277 [Methylorubrum aminovorans]|uniref:Uncharacterized protein n=1 Tax=Methylorubrum aminovorans TaxID=269069 RepID=A0ABQ4UCM4_9HYPH|nr:hypothetical protein LNAOJCKE_2277 [Methylorubrum aminovorans]
MAEVRRIRGSGRLKSRLERLRQACAAEAVRLAQADPRFRAVLVSPAGVKPEGENREISL